MQRSVVLAAALIVLLFGLMFFCSVRPTPGYAAGLAELAPADSYLFVAVDKHGQLDLDGILKDIESGLSTEERKYWDEVLNMPLSEWASLFKGRGFLAVDSQQRVMGAVELADVQGFEAWWEQTQQKSSSVQKHDVDGVTFLTLGSSSPFVGYDTKWVYLANGVQAAQRVMESVEGEEKNLANSPLFLEAKKSLKTRLSGAILFADTKNALTWLEMGSSAQLDQYSLDSLKDLEYLIATVDMSSSQIDGFLRVNSNSTFGKQLLLPGKITGQSLEAISQDIMTVHVVDGKWWMETGFALASLSPKLRSSAPMARLVLMYYGDPWAAFTGEVAVATNSLERLGTAVSNQAGIGDASFVVSAGIRDFELAHAMLAKVLPGSLKAPEKGKKETYPLPLGGKSSLTLSHTQSPTAVLNVGFEELQDTSRGAAASIQAIRKLRNWAGEGAVYIGYVDTRRVYDSAMEKFKEDGDDRTREAALLEKLARRVPTFYDSVGVTVKSNGVYLRSTGISNILIGGTLLGLTGPALLSEEFPMSLPQSQTSRRQSSGGSLFSLSSGETDLNGCKSNLKNIGTACEMYATDYAGLYPKNAGLLTPNYLRVIPECPAAGVDTYSEAYHLEEEMYDLKVEGYRVYCSGSHHPSLPADYPAYDSVQGLYER